MKPIMTLIVCWIVYAASGLAQAAAESPDPPLIDLPITTATLFSSGVGYFEHAGTVSGDAVLRLSFKIDQINDVLKSMVLFDLDGGTISSVSYAANDPLERTLRSFSVDLSASPTLPELLQQLRGVEVELRAPEIIRGRVLNIEQRQRPTPGSNALATEPVMNLVTSAGIRSLPLSSVESIQFSDPKLQEEMQRALQMLVGARDTDHRPVDIRLEGRGERRIRVGYLVETPVWKTSYRLDLSGDEPWLQGWAIVENTSNNDWESIHLALVSGRPISFIQDLYTPLYMPRPVVEPELYASLRPQTYDGGMAGGTDVATRERMRSGVRPSAPPSEPSAMESDAAGRGGGLFGNPGATGLRFSFSEAGVSAAAEGARLGELFQYQISHPVDLSRRRSAMLPIVNTSVTAERVSIYNAQVLVKHPLNGVQLTNTTGLKLLGGPVTVFDGSAYAGDAQVDHLAPNEKRLLSYAIDLDVLVDSSANATTRLESARIVKGVLRVVRRTRYQRAYVIRNNSSRDRELIIEHPRTTDRRLLEPTDAIEERTSREYRFRISVGADSTREFPVIEEQTHSEMIAILDRDTDALAMYVKSSQVPEDVRAALSHAVKLKQELSAIERGVNERAKELQQIVGGQERLRENIQTVGSDSPLGKRYLARLSEDEDRIDALREEITEWSATFEGKRRELIAYLNDLTVD